MKPWRLLGAGLGALGIMAAGANAQEMCEGFGPQTPRDIANPHGTNESLFSLALPASDLNLCNIHTHTNAEHRGPGFTIHAGDGPNGGWRCNGTAELSEAELTPPEGGTGAYGGVAPGDTIEAHWVYTSCPGEPGPGLGSCLSERCANPELRVEAQVFLVVNDPDALDFAEFGYAGDADGGKDQPRALPTGTGEPVVLHGSTTGENYDNAACSPYQVIWSVRPECAKLDIASLHRWAEEGNVFEERHSHAIRPLVTAPELLAPIE